MQPEPLPTSSPAMAADTSTDQDSVAGAWRADEIPVGEFQDGEFQDGEFQDGEFQDGEFRDGDAAATERKLGPLPLPRAPQRSLLLPAAFLFAVSAPALYTLSAATQHLSPWILIAYLFFVWAAGIALAFWRRRGLRPDSKTGWSARV